MLPSRRCIARLGWQRKARSGAETTGRRSRRQVQRASKPAAAAVTLRQRQRPVRGIRQEGGHLRLSQSGRLCTQLPRQATALHLGRRPLRLQLSCLRWLAAGHLACQQQCRTEGMQEQAQAQAQPEAGTRREAQLPVQLTELAQAQWRLSLQTVQMQLHLRSSAAGTALSWELWLEALPDRTTSEDSSSSCRPMQT